MILAADPGLTGAFASYDAGVVQVTDMPTYTAAAGARQTDRKFIDPAQVVSVLEGYYMLGCDTLVIELVGGIPGQAASSAFTFGHGVGVIIGAAIHIGYRIERVAASTWKSAMRCPKDKRAARARASELLPAYSGLWPLQKHDGRAEAAMLAMYGDKVFGSL